MRAAQTVCLGGLLLLFAVVRVTKTDTTIVFEAESYAALQAPMRVLHGDPSASGAACLVLPLGSGQGWRGTGKGSVTYRVDLLHEGRLFLWMRTLWGDGCTNAFFLSVNDGQRVIVGNDAIFGSWHWVKGPQIQVRKGLNYLTFSNHSDGTALDKIILTSNPFYSPEGLGEGITHFYDGFAGCDGNNTGSWTFVEGNWCVVPAVLEGASSAGDCLAQWDEKGGLAIGGFPVWHDYDAAVKVMLSGPGAIGLVLYHESPESEMRLVLDAEADSALLSLRQKEGGQWKTLGQECVREFCFDTWYELGFMYRAGQMICMLNGQPEMTIERALPRRGAIGLVTERVSGGYFDNVFVKFNQVCWDASICDGCIERCFRSRPHRRQFSGEHLHHRR